MVDTSFVLNLVETVGILIGVTIGIIEIRNIREERRNQMIDLNIQNSGRIETYEKWIRAVSQVFSSYEEWREKYGPITNPEAAKYMYAIWGIYDALGNNLRDGYIDADYMLKNISPIIPVIAIWERSKVIFEHWRERYNYPSMYDGFEYLYNIVKKEYPDVTFQ